MFEVIQAFVDPMTAALIAQGVYQAGRGRLWGKPAKHRKSAKEREYEQYITRAADKGMITPAMRKGFMSTYTPDIMRGRNEAVAGISGNIARQGLEGSGVAMQLRSGIEKTALRQQAEGSRDLTATNLRSIIGAKRELGQIGRRDSERDLAYRQALATTKDEGMQAALSSFVQAGGSYNKVKATQEAAKAAEAAGKLPDLSGMSGAEKAQLAYERGMTPEDLFLLQGLQAGPGSASGGPIEASTPTQEQDQETQVTPSGVADGASNISALRGVYGRTYTVKPGDTLSQIAPQFGLTWQELWKLNKDNIPNPDYLKPGQQLRVQRQVMA